jgi:FkbM family methyltransferase
VPGDTVLDAGANVGYMTLLAGVATGPSGRVIAWEPHPELFSVLQQNVTSVARSGKLANVILRNAALGRSTGTADLIVPKDIGSNDGISYIGQRQGSADSVSVKMETIDDVIGTMPISVLKLDVEGFELAVLSGASRALGAGQITHIVFEDHEGANSNAARLLESFGYELFSIGWSLRGPTLGAYVEGTLAEAYEAPSYVASREPDRVRRLCSTSGWMTLSREFPKRSRMS